MKQWSCLFAPWLAVAIVLVAASTGFGQAAGLISGSIADTQGEQINAVKPRVAVPAVRKSKAVEGVDAPSAPVLGKKAAASSTTKSGKGRDISAAPVTDVVFSGDANWLNRLEVKGPTGTNDLNNLFWGKTVNSYSIRRAILEQAPQVGISQVLDDARRVLMTQGGFYLIRLEQQSLKDGILTVRVDSGRFDQVTVEFENGRSRYFSEKQVLRRFEGITNEAVFDYNLLYDRFYDANSHPDLTVNARLTLTNETRNVAAVKARDEKGEPRLMDLNLTVREKLPIHAVLDFDNYGTEAAKNWTGRLTLQHLNLTKADDVLTVNLQTSLDDFASIYGVAASYYRPYYWGKGGGFTLYGGYTKADFEDVVPEIDVKGDGWFAGLQASARLIDNKWRNLSLSLGFVQRYVEDRLVVQGVNTMPNDVTVRPLSLALMYADKKEDAFHGFNYATVEGLASFGDWWGTSDKLEMRAQRAAADEDYYILKLQLARLQILGTNLRDASAGGKWMVFGRLNGQFSSGALIPAEQMGIGGANSVRGYEEREYLGDHAVTATVELRTPIMVGLMGKWIPGFDKPNFDRLQLVLFGDIGYTKIEDPLPAEDDDQMLSSIGLGLRLALSSYTQFRFDWGFPLEETPNSDHSGRGYINVQVQF